MNNIEEQLKILKNLIMSDEFISQDDLKKVVKAMDQTEKRPQVNKEVETR